MAYLYADENFPLPVVATLRNLGHDLLTIYEDGKANQSYPDSRVLADAVKHNRAVITLNRKHFVQLHHEVAEHYGVIVCSYDPDFSGQAQRIHQVVEALSSLQNQLVRVNRLP